MSKYCISCGAANSDTASVCIRCRRSFYVKGSGCGEPGSIHISNKKRSKGIGIIIIVMFVLFAVLFLYIGNGRIPKLAEAECEEIFSATIQEEKRYLEGIFEERTDHEPIDCSITDIEQDGNHAIVTFKLSAKYNYADCDLVCRCNSIYIDTTETWKEGGYERECNWNYHDLEGSWQEKDWHRSMVMEFDSGPSTLLVEKTADGYLFTATDNWVDEYQDTQVEVKMTDLSSDSDVYSEGGTRLFPKGYQSESSFQCYNLSPEEGITDMEKVEGTGTMQ